MWKENLKSKNCIYWCAFDNVLISDFDTYKVFLPKDCYWLCKNIGNIDAEERIVRNLLKNFKKDITIIDNGERILSGPYEEIMPDHLYTIKVDNKKALKYVLEEVIKERIKQYK